MLILTRKTKQSIMIGDVEITVLSNDGTKVRLGIDAPFHVPVHRKEIYLEIQGQGQESAGSRQPDLDSTIQGEPSKSSDSLGSSHAERRSAYPIVTGFRRRGGAAGGVTGDAPYQAVAENRRDENLASEEQPKRPRPRTAAGL